MYFDKIKIFSIQSDLFHHLGNILYDHSIDFVDTWREMEKLLDDGRVRSIGISNFNQQQTERILAVAKIVPVINQVECHPFKNKRSLIKFSSANNITVTAHTPLGRAKNETDTNSPIADPKVLALAKKHNKTPAQIVLRYSVFWNERTHAIPNIFK